MPFESAKPFAPKNREKEQDMAILLDGIPSLRTRPGTGRAVDDPKLGRPLPDSELLAGLMAGDLDRMAAAHRKGAKIDMDNNYPVRKAAREGFQAIVEWLHDRGANIRADDDYAVRYACANGHLETAQWLHARGADIRAVHDFAVIRAAGNGHIETVAWLHENGANIRAVSDYALRDAVSNKKAAMADWLCEHGADPKEIDNRHFIAAAREGDTAMVAFLLKHKTDRKLVAHAVIEAARHEHIDTLRFFQQQRFDVMPHIAPLAVRQVLPALHDYYNELSRNKNESIVSSAIAEALGEPAPAAPASKWRMLKPSTWRPK